MGDILDDAQPFALTDRGFRGLWTTVRTAAATPPGRYSGELRVRRGDETLRFPLTLDVLVATLPARKRMHLDIWQTPWSVARYYGVEPFSSAHYAHLEPIYRELADAGQRTITVTITEEKNRVFVDVTDTGKGIPPKMQRRIFSPGYTSKSRGWGLGLTLAKRIINNYHKGKLFVKSSVIDQGTTMRIQLRKSL